MAICFQRCSPASTCSLAGFTFRRANGAAAAGGAAVAGGGKATRATWDESDKFINPIGGRNISMNKTSLFIHQKLNVPRGWSNLGMDKNPFETYKVGPYDRYKLGEITPIGRVKQRQENPFIRPFIGVITQFITSRAHPCRRDKYISIIRIPGWWLNQPIWKICPSNWKSSPNKGENEK